MTVETVQLCDRIPIKGARRDGNGNLICPATVARTGIYEYAGYELGRPEMRVVRVFRPPDEVFNRDTMRSIAGIPVTIKHPKELVTTDNWADHAKGETSSDDIVRDGEAVKVPFILRDEGAIKAVEDGKHELSPGYTAVIDWTAGQNELGEEYDAVARNIRYNHLAVVDKARGGEGCRIGDHKPEDKTVDTKLILVDGFSVETTEQGERAIIKLVDERKTLTDEVTDLKTKLADAEKAKGTLEGEKAALESQLKDATSPAKLSIAAAARAKLVDQAKALLPKIVTDDKGDDEIRKEVVTAKLGDVAAGFDVNQINGAFLTLAATVKASKGGKDQLADALRDTVVDSDDTMDDLRTERDKARAKRLSHLNDAHRFAGDNGDKE